MYMKWDTWDWKENVSYLEEKNSLSGTTILLINLAVL